MKLSTPKMTTFWIAVVVAVIGLILYVLKFHQTVAFLLELVAFLILAAGNLFDSL
jgi:Ni,Fe-hydrogenase I cytochrome b subunit